MWPVLRCPDGLIRSLKAQLVCPGIAGTFPSACRMSICFERGGVTDSIELGLPPRTLAAKVDRLLQYLPAAHGLVRELFLAGISLRSPRKLFIFII